MGRLPGAVVLRDRKEQSMFIFRRKGRGAESGQAAASSAQHKDFREGYVHVHGSEKKADELAMRAYGDTDGDGKPDVPFMPFPG